MAQPTGTFEPSTNLSSDQVEQTVPNTIFNTLQPYLYEYDECIRNVRDYKQLTRQFLESSGIQTIGPFPGGIELVSVYVSGPTCYKCITDTILMVSGLSKGASSKDGKIVIDTSKTNDYTGGDIAPGYQKLYQVTYIVNDVTFIETKTTTSTKFVESTVTVQTRDQYDDGTYNAVQTTAAANQKFSSVYAINSVNVNEDTGGTYGEAEDVVKEVPIDTTNATEYTNTKACPTTYYSSKSAVLQPDVTTVPRGANPNCTAPAPPVPSICTTNTCN